MFNSKRLMEKLAASLVEAFAAKVSGDRTSPVFFAV
jgi:hypothetical protein